MKLLDLFCGNGGWSQPWHYAGHKCTGVDIIDTGKYPGKLCQIDILKYKPDDDYDFVVMSPPCQEFSRHDQPWTRKKNPPEPSMEFIFAGLEIARRLKAPFVLENVRGAQRWIGKAPAHHGPFYLWGDLPGQPPQWNSRVRTKTSMTSNAQARAEIPHTLAQWLADRITNARIN